MLALTGGLQQARALLAQQQDLAPLVHQELAHLALAVVAMLQVVVVATLQVM